MIEDSFSPGTSPTTFRVMHLFSAAVACSAGVLNTVGLCCRFSPLHHAALNGNLELISILLESQAAVDIRDQKGELTSRERHLIALGCVDRAPPVV